MKIKEFLRENTDTVPDLPDEHDMHLMRELYFNPEAIAQIKNPSAQMKTFAVKRMVTLDRWTSALQYIDNPTEAQQQRAVTIYPITLLQLKNPSEKTQEIAVTQSPAMILQIKNPSDTLKKIAVEKDPWLLSHIDDLNNQLKQVQKTGLIRLYSGKRFNPGSRFHKMLEYVAANPGEPRSGWFVRYLGLDPEGMPSFNSDKSADGFAALTGLITARDPGRKPTTYQLRITPWGQRILDRLNQGQKLKISDLIDSK